MGGRVENNDKLLTPREAAEMLCVSLRTVQDWTREGRLPSIPWGPHRRYKRADLERIISGKPDDAV